MALNKLLSVSTKTLRRLCVRSREVAFLQLSLLDLKKRYRLYSHLIQNLFSEFRGDLEPSPKGSQLTPATTKFFQLFHFWCWSFSEYCGFCSRNFMRFKAKCLKNRETRAKTMLSLDPILNILRPRFDIRHRKS